MSFMPVFLLSDIVIWLLVASCVGVGLVSWRSPLLRAAWLRLGASRSGMGAATVLLFFIVIGLTDSLHYRARIEDAPDGKHVYAVEVLSLLDAVASPLRQKIEKTYSAPLATHAFAKETIESVNAAGQVTTQRVYPRLAFGGPHLGEQVGARDHDVGQRVLRGASVGLLAIVALSVLCALLGSMRQKQPLIKTFADIWCGRTQFAANAVFTALVVLGVVSGVIFSLCVDYHVFGTDKVGQDVFYQILKSVRTALVIGLVTTLVTLPIAIAFGIVAGYFRGWVDDLIQYLYTTLSSVPSVLLIAAAVLMMQVIIDTHPQWFETSAERADLRLLSLCFIMGMTSWTSLCRLLRGETLKLRELEYIQAAEAFGVSSFRILLRHVLPNLMHIVIIALVMDFSGLVLAEAVLSYVGIGVDPNMTSFGTMINNARMELAREPVVWWSLVAAFSFMFILVLAANLFADAVRDAFDPRSAGAM